MKAMRKLRYIGRLFIISYGEQKLIRQKCKTGISEMTARACLDD